MATIKDVAKRAGVSPSTASRAMHDSPLISEETKARVKKAMTELDYSPNFVAQNLANQTSNTLGVVLPAREEDVGDNPFFIQIIQGLASICNAHDYLVSVASGQTSAELIKNIETMIKRGNITRFVFVYSQADDPVLEFVKRQKHVRYVMIGTPYTEKETLYHVDNDNYLAGYDAACFLLDKGYETIIYAYTDLAENVQNARFKGYEAAVKESGRKSQAVCFAATRADEKKDRELLQKALPKDVKKVAILACDDNLALALQHLCGLEEEAIAVMGFNNSALAKLARPALTSVEIFPRFLGSEAAALAIKSDTLKLESNAVIVPHKIIERESTKI
ncbi:LacI family DNA-binding transcriptional regulator [Ligilactobacillus faecis]|uniref:LacI family DNA-binding transcriptional regulator n=1 Tax=Ligilactobacillus faecis TaxID=762833 RepID=UPI00246968F5|nr:LacI family DNA-binding transcriptional regulator [Ligilactobacillus faecis]WGN90243.1 LacI family DNA-binding transcriptional regulator [Ligilactobacillus faecis]